MAFLFHFLALTLSASQVFAGSSLPVFKGRFEMVLCAEEPEIQVRGENLQQVVFTVPNHEPVKVFQGWGKTKQASGDQSFVKIQVPRQEQAGSSSIGWVKKSLVMQSSQCASLKQQDRAALLDGVFPWNASARSPRAGGEIQGLNDPKCCMFPTAAPVTADFSSGMRRFGASRSGGSRLHAACDLYRHLNEPIRAVAPGLVIRDKYFFYQGTYALEVRHNGGFVVRYGEVTGRNAPGVETGGRVQTGQRIAYMGKVNSNCCEPMLHFELFSGAAQGSLSGSGPYHRRSDLLNPTRYLRKWESDTFRFWR